MYPEYARDTITDWVAGPPRGGLHARPRPRAATLIERAPAGVVLLPSPNNPTGTALPPDGDRRRCARRRATGWWSSTRRTPSSAAPARRARSSCCREHRNLVVTRTMSKAFALAGARLGYLAADPEICDALRVVRLPYHLSAVTQAVALAALRHATELLGRVDELRAERDATVAWLREQGLEVADSDANFVLFGAFADRHAVWQGLLDRGVLIRETGPDGLAAGLDRHRRRRWQRSSRRSRQVMASAGHGGEPMSRTARIERADQESKVLVEVDLDGTGRADVSTGVGFYDHMLTAFARHALVDLTVADRGRHPHRRPPHRRGHRDRARPGAARGARRQGRHPPLRRRAPCRSTRRSCRPSSTSPGAPTACTPASPRVRSTSRIGGDYVGSLTRHVFETLAFHAQIALHVRVLAGRDPHHIVEAQFKAVARALPRRGRARPARDRACPSTKGTL